ncbi:DoxX family protein [Flavobacterium agricola]|uniref:DoxX family protein n=1 Tax=Flavobacterium agricola TaxID=2870839 RepID=UPI002221BA40|nr:DoxX family protein [Flavobacterium agricola]
MRSFLRVPAHKSTSINFSLLLLRIVAGGFMLTHGFGKMQKLFLGDFTFSDPLGIGMELSLILTVFAEIVCALFIVLGLFTRFVSIPLMITMIVAVFIVHAGHDFGRKELGLFYLASYFILFISGPGKYSLDAKLY